jgi:acetoin utilization protein AcuB
MYVKLWMKKDVVVVNQEQSLVEADMVMRQHSIRRLPVVDADNKLVGILTRQDIMKARPIDSTQDNEGLGVQAPISAFMTTSPITVDPMEPLEAVTQILRQNKIGGVPVVERDGKLVGILTESDICQAVIDLLGAGENGARIELQVGKTTRELYEAFEIFKDFEMLVISVAVYPNYSEKHQLLTIRVQGDEMQTMVDTLWKSGCKVHRIMIADD